MTEERIQEKIREFFSWRHTGRGGWSREEVRKRLRDNIYGLRMKRAILLLRGLRMMGVRGRQ